MSRVETILTNIVQLAGPLARFQERLVAVKFHPDAVSVVQLQTGHKRQNLERLVSWSLSSDIGRQPLQENHGFLVNQVSQAAREANISGVDAGICIPTHLFTMRIVMLPYMTYEEIAQEAELPEFWQEYDPDLANIEGHIIRFQILSTNQTDDRTVVLFCALPIVEVERYKNLLLEANLVPIYLENEALSLLNAVMGKLDMEDIFKPLMILHMCPHSNVIISYARNEIHIHPMQVSDFDEALLFELEEVEDVSGDFWDEVAIRLGEQIKQAIAFMVETYHCPRPERLIFIYEHKSLENIVQLLLNRTGNIILEPWNALADMEITPAQARYIDYFRNPTVFASAFGLAQQSLNLKGVKRARLAAQKINMNFLDSADKIRRNRQMSVLNRALGVLAVGFLLASGLLLGITSVPTYLQTRQSGALYENLASGASREAMRKTIAEKKIAELREQNNIISGMVRRVAYLKFLDSLPNIVPQNAELQSLTIDENSQMSLVGLALDDTVVSDIRRNLIKQRFAKNATETVVRDGAYIRFTISAVLTELR